ncbi:unnamed protein product [Zymoseptoria tritici ST99CH_3D7]|uniref:Uncharacterized protein n=1 Tax=Zymoseptoria tritici (strain ST99CH_3D7) TaxID=1276538 RepID=A0A1X7RN51_ZYMT9|nr:unnamed protein product [Zymoseptoria tritici ST99CH_3D7]
MAIDKTTVKAHDKANMNTQSNGVVVQRGRRRRGRRGSRTYSGWVIDKALKLFVWYSLVTVFFRCPAPENLTDDSPRICKPYLQAKDYVTPYAQPYYDQYLSPYVQKAQPYYESFNTHLYQPAQTAYTKHAAPRVADAQKISQQQWEKTVKPQLDVLQQQAGKQYQAVLGPHVKKATDVIQPYYNSVMNSASDIWELELAPVYRKTSPYAQKLYVQGQHFAVNTALPQAQYAGNVLWSFWSRYIWPKVRILYGENVEPQLMRITERLGRYKDGKKLEAGISSMEASSKLAEASSTAESIASSLSSTASVVTASPSSVASSAISASSAPTPDPDVDPTKHFHDDLKNWEQITAKAVEEGAEDLKERIKDITAHQVTSGGKVGEALVTQLERTSETALNTVKARIQGIVEDIPEDADDDRLERANEDLVKAIRAVGQTVKSRAQAVREWRQTSQTETENLIEKAVQSTLEVIDNIRELRLTEIGRKYSSTSLPHKEWSKYNDLKKATQTWRGQIEKAAQSHPGLKTAKAASEDIEQTGMAIAEDTAKELGRLKAVGKWKIAAADASDDFETKTIPAPMRRIKDQIVEKVAEASEAVVGKEQGTAESVSSVASAKASEYASSASEAVVGSSAGSAESVASQASSAASSVSAKVMGSSTGSVERAASQASSSAESAASQASSAASSLSEKVIGSSTGSVENAASQVSESASSLADKVVGSPPGSIESAASRASSSAQSASSQASGSAKSASSDASKSAPSAASKASSSVKSASSQASKSAQDAASQVSKSAQSAPSRASDSAQGAASKVSGSAESAASVVSKKVVGSSAGSAESAATEISKKVIGTESGISDSATDAASSVSSAAKDAASSASSAVFGGGASDASAKVAEASKSASSIVDAPPASKASSSAASVASQVSSALPDAEEIAASAESIASKASEAPKKVWGGAMAQVIVEAREPILDDDIVDGDGSYSASILSMVDVAQDYASELTKAVEDALKGAAPTQGTVESVTSLASEQYESALAAASSALFGTTQNAAERGTSIAHEQYLSAVTAASYAIYGTPVTAAPFAHATSAYSNAMSEAGQHYENAMSRISAKVSGTPAPVHEQMYASVESAYFAAVQAANGRFSNAFVPKTQGTYESISSIAASRLSDSLSAASAQYQSAKVAVGAKPTPVHQQYLASAQAAYYQALGVAHGRYSEFIDAASSAVAPTATTGASASMNSMLASAQSAYSAYLADASSKYSALSAAATGAAATQSKGAGKTLDNLQKQLGDAVEIAGSKLSAASASASSAFAAQTTEQAVLESVTSRASENWEALVSKASENIYGAPPPFTDAAYSQITSYGAQATDAAVAQWDQVSALFSELIVGKEPDFTDSVYSRLQSAYATGAPAALSSASSLLDEGASSASTFVNDGASSASSIVYDVASSASSYASEAYESAASAVSAVFVPPTEVPSILDQVTEQLNAAVEAASQQVYGTSAGYVEQASSAAFSAYDAASSAASSVVYGSPAGYADAAQSSFSDIGASASSAISAAMYGGPTPSLTAASNAAASVYSEVLDQAQKHASVASAAVSSRVYGEEKTYLEEVQARVAEAVASANSKLSELGVQATQAASGAASRVEEVVEQVTERIRDEL